MNQIHKIAITGPESTGKSSMAESLANHFNTAWAPEYARNYLSKIERPYNEDDLLEIAKGQVEIEKEELNNASRFLFCDTEMIVMKIWSLHKYKKVDSQILDFLEQNEYDLHLLMNVDLEWQSDPMRENPDQGQFFFDWFKKELSDKNAKFEIISGHQTQRLECAINAIKKHF